MTTKEALKNRRTCYSITSESPVPDEQIKEILAYALMHVPSAFNSQSTRVVLLLGDQHKKMWEITKNTLRKIVAPEKFKETEARVDSAFAAGHGTVLFYEDTEVVENMQKAYPTYSDNFPIWSQHTSGMHQLAIWTMLSEVGFGASLQHYNPLIDADVAAVWNINPKWKLIAEMPFGKRAGEPTKKEFDPLEKRLLVFG